MNNKMMMILKKNQKKNYKIDKTTNLQQIYMVFQTKKIQIKELKKKNILTLKYQLKYKYNKDKLNNFSQIYLIFFLILKQCNIDLI